MYIVGIYKPTFVGSSRTLGGAGRRNDVVRSAPWLRAALHLSGGNGDVGLSVPAPHHILRSTKDRLRPVHQ